MTYSQNLLQSKPLYRPEGPRARMSSQLAGTIPGSGHRLLKGQWPLYIITEKNGEIDYRLFFDDAKGANPEALEYMESLRENVEVMSLLAVPAR